MLDRNVITGIVGVEHEYRVLRDGEPVDFRVLLRRLSLPGGGLDPGDPNAHHLPSGLLLTADGAEAEVATPPITLWPGATRDASAWSELAERALLASLPAGLAVEGYSTHLNVSVQADVVSVARLFAERFALGMMLLLERADSPGLLVRPRPGRLEIGGEFAEGAQLRGALTYAAGAARSCERAVAIGSTSELPPAPRARIVRAKDRPGWFVDRNAFGGDLYAGGRAALVRAERSSITAADHLVAAWDAARTMLMGSSGDTELELVDELVAGRQPIPLEAPSPPDRFDPPAPGSNPFGRLHARQIGELRVVVAALSWSAVAFTIGPGTAHVVVPRVELDTFLDRLDASDVDTRSITAGHVERAALVELEPSMPLAWWRGRTAELAGAAAGCALVLATTRVWP